MQNGDLLTVGQAAEILGVTSQTIRNWTKSGHLTSVRHSINHYRYYNCDEVQRLRDRVLSPRESYGSEQAIHIDWNFPKSETRNSIHSIHPYPAKFIPEIPRSLIDLFPPPPNTWIFDPFCGSGTTLVEAQDRGINSVGIDLNPIACLLSRVKTQQLPLGFEQALRRVSQNAPSRKSDLSYESRIPKVNHWFDREIAKAIDSVRNEILEQDSKYHDALNLALSSILVRVSRQDSDTRYAAIEKNLCSDDVYSQFLDSGIRLSSLLSQRPEAKNAQVDVIQSDIMAVKSIKSMRSIGLLITSPPYPNAYEYWLYHKYRMYWLSEDPIAVRKREIGARAHYFKKNIPTPDDFFAQMLHSIKIGHDQSVVGSHFCYVVGRSVVHGKEIDNADIILRAGLSIGLTHVTTINRTINSTRKSFNLSHANIKEESIVVLRRDK